MHIYYSQKWHEFCRQKVSCEICTRLQCGPIFFFFLNDSFPFSLFLYFQKKQKQKQKQKTKNKIFSDPNISIFPFLNHILFLKGWLKLEPPPYWTHGSSPEHLLHQVSALVVTLLKFKLIIIFPGGPHQADVI